MHLQHVEVMGLNIGLAILIKLILKAQFCLKCVRCGSLLCSSTWSDPSGQPTSTAVGQTSHVDIKGAETHLQI